MSIFRVSLSVGVMRFDSPSSCRLVLVGGHVQMGVCFFFSQISMGCLTVPPPTGSLVFITFPSR